MQPRRDRAREGIHGAAPGRLVGIRGRDGAGIGIGRSAGVRPELGTVKRDAVIGNDAIRDPGLIDDVGPDCLQPIRMVDRRAEVHEVHVLIGGGVRVSGAVKAIAK